MTAHSQTAVGNPLVPAVVANVFSQDLGHFSSALPTRNRGTLAPWQIRRVIDFIDDNLSTTIRIDDLAGLVRLSSSYFATAFKAVFGQAPHQYIIARRVDHARHLLLNTSIPLCEIAIDCGLVDQAHLCTLFRKKLGTTPSSLRKLAA